MNDKNQRSARHYVEPIKLTQAELKVMSILWDSKEGMTTRQIQNLFPNPKPAYSTIGTFLKILTTKKYICHNKVDKSHAFIFSPVVQKEEYVRYVLRQFVKNYYKGSATSFILSLLKDGLISKSDLEHLLHKEE